MEKGGNLGQTSCCEMKSHVRKLSPLDVIPKNPRICPNLPLRLLRYKFFLPCHAYLHLHRPKILLTLIFIEFKIN